MTPAELLKKVFQAADEAHTTHLITRRLEEHEALGEFYEGVREAVDTLIESMIGLGMDPPPKYDFTMLECLAQQYIELKGARKETCNGHSELENQYDELLAVYVKAIYKLKRFTQ